MKIKAEEFIERNLEAFLPHLLKANADNQVRNPLSGLYLKCKCLTAGISAVLQRGRVKNVVWPCG